MTHSAWGPPAKLVARDVLEWPLTFLGCFGATWLFSFGIGVAFWGHGWWALWTGVTLGIAGLVRAATTSARTRRRRLAAFVRELGTDEGEVPARLTVRLGDGGPVFGEDIGAVCTEDGWLIFRGARTEWAVRADEVALRMNGFGYQLPSGGMAEATLWTEGRPGRLAPVFFEWWGTRPRPGLSILPPATMPPERPGRDLRYALLWIAGGLFVLYATRSAVVESRMIVGGVFLTMAAIFLGTRSSHRRALRRAGAWPKSLPTRHPGGEPS